MLQKGFRALSPKEHSGKRLHFKRPADMQLEFRSWKYNPKHLISSSHIEGLAGKIYQVEN